MSRPIAPMRPIEKQEQPFFNDPLNMMTKERK
jgi:hypothetical protein